MPRDQSGMTSSVKSASVRPRSVSNASTRSRIRPSMTLSNQAGSRDDLQYSSFFFFAIDRAPGASTFGTISASGVSSSISQAGSIVRVPVTRISPAMKRGPSLIVNTTLCRA